LLGYARRILMLNDEAVGRLRDHKVEGVVRLGVMDDYGSIVVPPLLARFVSGYPLIHVEMENRPDATMANRLGESFDLVIAMHPEGRGDGEFLRREQAVWAAGASHPVEALEPASCRALSAWMSVPEMGHGGARQCRRPWRWRS